MNKLDQIMRDEGRTSTWLANRIGCTIGTVCRWRRGEMPRSDYVQAVAVALGRDVGDIFFTAIVHESATNSKPQ